MRRRVLGVVVGLLGALAAAAPGGLPAVSAAGRAAQEEAPADLILRGGKVVTVDRRFHVRQALAVRGNRLARVGTDEEVLRLRGPETRVVDLKGRMVLPGLMDSHVHPTGASMVEFDHPIPEMESVADVLEYLRRRAEALPDGEWISLRQVFITRLREQRYPTRAELDRIAPKNPVIFSTGPDASLSSLALQESGIDRDFKITDGGPGFIEKDARGEPTGILRSCTRFVKSRASGRTATSAEEDARLLELLRDYAATGLTSVCDRDAGPGAIARYRRLHAEGKLPIRVSLSHHVDTLGPIEAIQEKIRAIGQDPLCKGDDWLRIIGIKTYLDGGMLTGSAYMRRPWGVSKIYSITDPEYRGVLFIPKERLVPIVRAAVESGLQFTAHSVGDGAVHALLDAYEEVDRTTRVRKVRPCITHSNFMSPEAIVKLRQLGGVVDIQPAWLYLDTHTLVAQFGYDRLRYFQPLRSLFAAGVEAGGGSDHMQKVGSLRSVNPYNPFLGMATAITRRSKRHPEPLHPEEALTREQAIRFYTANNAYLLFKEDRAGSLEAGKLADFIVLDRDLLTCPEEDLRGAQVLQTYVDGRLIYDRAAKSEKPREEKK